MQPPWQDGVAATVRRTSSNIPTRPLLASHRMCQLYIGATPLHNTAAQLATDTIVVLYTHNYGLIPENGC